MRVTTAQAAGPPASHTSLLDVLDIVASCITNLKDLAMLGACSNSLKQTVKQSVIQYHGSLLTEWVSESVYIDYSDKPALQRWSEGLQWCLKATDGFRKNAAGHVLTLPDVRLHVIEDMLENGFTFTYQQLVEAARQRVAGVECWVHVLVARGLQLPTDLSQLAVEVTCSGYNKYKERGLQFVLEALNPSNIADVLHLVTNRSQEVRGCSYDAVDILEHLLQPSSSKAHDALLQQITPQLLQELMQTAVDRNYELVFCRLLGFPAVDKLDTAAVLQIFSSAMQLHEQQDFSYICEDSFSKLALYLDATSTFDLLLVAVKSRSPATIGLFRKPDVEKHIGSEVIETLIRDLISDISVLVTAIEAMHMLRELCKFSAAQGLSSSCITDCLAALVTAKHHDSTIETIRAVTQLRPAQLLSASAVQELVETAVLHHNQAAAVVLSTLPAAAQLSVNAFYMLLQQSVVLYDDKAMQQGEAQLLPVLLDMPAVASLSASRTVNIIQYAVTSYRWQNELLEWLLLKLVTSDASRLLQLIEAATSKFKTRCMEVQDKRQRSEFSARMYGHEFELHSARMYDHESEWEVIQAVLRTSTAQQLSVQQVQQLVPLLVDNVAKSVRSWIEVVCKLPVVQQLTAEDMHQMLSLAINRRCKMLAYSLLRLPAAQTLPAASTQVLLVDAVKRNISIAVRELCSLPSAKLVQLPVLVEVVLLSMESGLVMEARGSLCDLLLEATHCRSSSKERTGVEQSQQQWQEETHVSFNTQQSFTSQTSNTSTGQHHQQPEHQHLRHSQAAFQDSAELTEALNKVVDAAIEYRCLPAIKSWFGSSSPSIAILFTSGRVVQLMECATEQQSWRVLQLLCDHPAATDAPVQLAERMLLFAVQHRRSTLVQKLCELPVVADIGLNAAERLLWQAQTSTCQSVVHLLLDCIPATMSLDAAEVIALIKVDLLSTKVDFLAQEDGSNLLHYLSVPAVQDFTADQVMSLLKVAVAASHWSLVEALCREVPAAQVLDAAAVEAVLRHCMLSSRDSVRKEKVVHGEGSTAVAKLCQLPGFLQLGSEAVSALRKAAVSHRCEVVLAQLPVV